MRFLITTVLLMFVMLPGLAWAVETQEPTEYLAADANVADVVGLGTEGYGSPIQSDTIMSGELISTRSGNFHPFLSLGTYHTDNLFNTENDEQSDTVAVISPGMWVALPGSRQKLVDINTMNTAPGGLSLSRFRNESERRFQGYALYRADIREHDKYTEENRTDHRGEGYLGVNLRGGLSLELINVYEVKADPYGTGGTPSREFDKFTSNLFNMTLAYQITPKVTLRGDYGHYYLDYDADRNEYRNRQDDSFSAYVFYQITPKTDVFVQTEYIKVDYDEDIKSDSDEMNYYVGIQLKATAKTRGRVKVGYGDKEYDRSDHDDQDDWLAEVQLDHFFTPKTSVYLRAVRRILESDIETARNITEYSTQIGYRQRFTAKLRGEASLFYANDEYDGDITVGDQTDERDDDYIGFVAALGFTPVRWLNLSLGYEYRDRDSNFNTEDYTSNTVFIRMTAAL
ncbi:MAG: outer membrane beta-barrel protein [Desulfuromonadales bacterium]|nr:outer membrane beta-barrel protein [Desulfuromonadales bacterium]